MTKPNPVKYHTRGLQKSNYQRVHKAKVTPDYRLNDNYFSYENKLCYPQVTMPTIPVENDIEFEIKPTIKKTCARCKESNRCVKLVCSRIHRLEELVKNIVKTTEKSAMNVNNNNTLIKQERQPPSLISQVFVTQPLQLPTPLPSPIQAFSSPPNFTSSDFSNYSLEELQKVVSAITNTMNGNGCVKPNAIQAFNPYN